MKHRRNQKGAGFTFPSTTLGAWRVLDDTNRALWLRCAFDRQAKRGQRAPQPGREVVLDGALVDGRLGFYCAIGEAVNGPSGYFGGSLMAFDDCLFGGFGLDAPFTIVWKDAELSKSALGSRAYAECIEREWLKDPFDEEHAASCREALRAAERGEGTLFDKIVHAIRTLAERGRAGTRLVLE
jgi:RNAse (barnase) inhibitor barstar